MGGGIFDIDLDRLSHRDLLFGNVEEGGLEALTG
jgi:hypothetical protein